MKKVGIIQPNYIPWRGFFDFVQEVDVFVFLDDVQYTIRDWRNRNRIRTRDGKSVWLTVPVCGGRNQLIKDVQIDDGQKWKEKHLEAIRHNYSGTPFFKDYYEPLEEVIWQNWTNLCSLDVELTRLISGWLGIETTFILGSSLQTEGVKDGKLIDIVKSVGGDCYLSGPAAKAYIQDEMWKEAGIELSYKDYLGYPSYSQISEPFDPAVSILDLLFMRGLESPKFIWGELRGA